ncbi:MAG: TetR/AcrR family transcriptional regulator [Leptolyngbyaceae cyanobacterium T60_A2020_046]|nr:TetR/AcrR family transcriptional regulator [Leptolyngbyaceae cyanobacterium T60_A2020_046]
MTAVVSKTDKANQILQGALQEFLARGYAGTSMDRVAATAGVSKPTVYNYFQDKEGLFCVLVQKIAQERFQLKFNADTFTGPPETTLRTILGLMLETVAQDDEYQDFVRLVIGESGRFPELARTFLTYITKPGLELVQGYLDQHPELRLLDNGCATHVILGTVVYAMLTQYIMHGEDLIVLSRDRLIDTLVMLLMAHYRSATEG